MNIKKYATIEAYCGGIPVYAFGYTYIYGKSPTFIQNVIWQDGNKSKPRKIILKKSWEIKNNKLGSTPPREPKTAANDNQPLLCAHLIDGDPDTCWCSRGQAQPDVEDVWIRIDLPMESKINSVTLIPSKKGMRGFNPTPNVLRGNAVGQALPKILTIKISRDGWYWETVYKNYNLTIPQEMEPIKVSFDTRLAKQIWVIGRELPNVMDFGHCFSISGIEVKNEKGNNLALHSRGAGVTVSSTHLGYGMDRFTQDMLWPIQYDLGFKWSRIGYDMSMFQWAYVEREKGKLMVDSKADAAISEAVKNGINFIMVLDKGNWLYAPNPRCPDRTRELMETYYNMPPLPTVNKDYFRGWLNYVRFMVNHFKSRIKYFEIWNEWSPYTREGAKEYCKLAKPTIKVIREEYPEAKIVAVSLPGHPIAFEFIEGCLEAGLCPMIDVIGFHPWYQANPEDKAFRSYPENLRTLKKMAESYGFKGEYMATEWTWSAPYPAVDIGPWNQKLIKISEIQKAKYAARLMITHVAFDIVSFWNETFQTQFTYWDVGLLRNTFSADPINPTQPQPVYYALRTLSTILEDVRPFSLDVSFITKDREIKWYSLKRGNGEILLALWISDNACDDDSQEVATDIILSKAGYKSAIGFDILNGTEQKLNISKKGNHTLLKGIKLKDWPLIIAFR